MIKGNIIFWGNAIGNLFDYDDIRLLKVKTEKIILYVDALTPEVAFYIINNNVSGIITRESSFATHGANILRFYISNQTRKVVWIARIDRKDISHYFNKKIELREDGVIQLFDDNFVPKSANINVAYVPLPQRCIVELNVNTGKMLFCYWSHRLYNPLTFSVMESGLKKSFEHIGFSDVHFLLDSDGKIWFENCPSIRDLIQYACDRNNSYTFLQLQIKAYERIMNLLPSCGSLKFLAYLLNLYFSVFILFHDTYEFVLEKLYKELIIRYGENKAYSVINCIMNTRIDGWMLNNNIVLVKKKNLLSTEKIVPLPDFNIPDDISYSRSKLFYHMKGLGIENDFIEYTFYSDFFVAKEWKFVLNKILFTRFSDMLKRKFNDKELTEIAFMDVKELF